MAIEMSPSLRIGVDCGGTNTDAVVLDLTPGAGKVVLAATKTPTTPEVTHGIQKAISTVLERHPEISKEHIQAICVGTTHFVNALISRSTDRLARVAVIRLCGPFTRAAPPFAGFPYELREILEGPNFMVEGGLQIDGSIISPINEAEIEAACEVIKAQGIHSVVISGVFSPIDFVLKQEEQVASIINRLLPAVYTTCSHTVANIGLLERENATILNASLLPFARTTVQGFKEASRALGLDCPIFVTSNDGTLLDLHQAAALPIRTFSSGPTNSMRGASFLANLADPGSKKETALVVDVGGTTTEVGVLLPSGFPRQAASRHELCGVPLSFPMPHVTSVGLGGGSLVRDVDGKVSIGPDSVGYRILEEGLVFGGNTLTTTDVAVASGAVTIGNPARVTHITPALTTSTFDKIRTMMERALDCMKTSSKDIPVYLVGGGAFLIPEDLRGVSKVHRFPHYECANAVGAAIAQVAGEVDVVMDIANSSMRVVQKKVEEMAIERARSQGAKSDTIAIVESEAIPIAYTAGRCRFFVKAAGDWAGQGKVEDGALADASDPRPVRVNNERRILDKVDASLDAAAILDYRPRVEKGVWDLSELDLEFIAIGTYILGCGGGGEPSHCYLAAREMVRDGHHIRVVDLSSLDPGALCGWGGYLGSPEVTAERLFGEEYQQAMEHLLKFMNIAKTDIKGLIPLEIGGANGMINLLVCTSSVLDIPLVDGDFMGRAYPTAWQTTPNVYDTDGDRGKNLLPACIASGDGNIMFMTSAKTSALVDMAFRAACTEMGTLIGYAAKPLTAEFCQQCMIKNTTSLSWRLGREVVLANKQANVGNIHNVLINALGGPSTARLLFAGKITHVDRRVYKGHTVGEVTIAALATEEEDDGEDEGKVHFDGIVTIPFKNENLYLEHNHNGEKKILASVPDLISVLDAQNGKALGTPDYKYGLRVLILGVTAAPQWTSTERGLELGDLRAFGYSGIPYVPLGEYIKPRSVIEEFNVA